MISRLAEQQTEEQDTEFVLVVLEETDDGLVKHQYEDDEVAEALTIPGGMVQVIDMNGDRNDAHANSFILMARGDWRVWVGGGETREQHDVAEVWRFPHGQILTKFHDDRPKSRYGNRINRVKRTKLCVT